ncbi:MAG: hypothetical protein LBC93_03620 [Synergistaceae bacterium]|jgi:hypothetical protein|nr:hypothetical protein [Synergistaceae bacterium]
MKKFSAMANTQEVRVTLLKHNRREGIGIIETLILLVVLGVTLSAIFTTMAWTSRSYIFGRKGRESRELLFNFVQAFESVWSPGFVAAGAVPPEAEEVARILGGTWDSSKKQAAVNGFILKAASRGSTGGSMVLRITISTEGKNIVELDRAYNIYSNETTSDDKV